MVIRRKDGNVYVLTGPNPIVAEQVPWDLDSLVFHNFRWDELVLSMGGKGPAGGGGLVVAEPNPPDVSEVKPETFKTEEPDTEPETEPANPPTDSAERDHVEDGREFDMPYIRYKVLCHCLPAKVKVHVDKLYGESWQKVTYGKKFIFPCVVVESGDMALDLWTSDPREQVTEKSIVYPFSYEVHNQATGAYDRVPYDEYRWWRVSGREKKEGGWLVKCVPSSDQPDFSD